MNLKSLLVDTKSAWVDYPGLPGFQVEIVNLGRERLIAIRKGSLITKYDRKTRLPEETLDEKKFVAEFTKATVTNWKGLKFSYLEGLLLADVSAQDPNGELEYSEENAADLVTNSTEFDRWLNDAVFDLENFRTGGKGAPVGEA